ncbi:MAG: hypothetical protein IJ849_02435 [Selenomonadaceae bacterium]|nr:hypothetical protein [Selenomonadaceae bacterium]
MKASYPVIIRRGATHYIPYSPDFDIATQGTSTANALDMIQDAIEMMGQCYLDCGRQIPSPSPLNAISCKDDEILSTVEVDFSLAEKAAVAG